MNQISNKPPPFALHLSIRKDPRTGQYYTELQTSTNTTYVKVVIDLGGLNTWFTCEAVTNTTHHPTARSHVNLTGAETSRAPAARAAPCHNGPGAPTTRVDPMFTTRTETCYMAKAMGQDHLTTLSTITPVMHFRVRIHLS